MKFLEKLYREEMFSSLSDTRKWDGHYQREFDEKRIEKTARMCYNENNNKLKVAERRFFLWNRWQFFVM